MKYWPNNPGSSSLYQNLGILPSNLPQTQGSDTWQHGMGLGGRDPNSSWFRSQLHLSSNVSIKLRTPVDADLSLSLGNSTFPATTLIDGTSLLLPSHNLSEL